MQPRGTRLACSLRSADGCNGSYDVIPGDAPRSIKLVEPARWDKTPGKEVMQGTFSLIGEMGMTGTLIMVNQYQWRDLKLSGLEQPFYAAILWGGNPMKVVEDAAMLAKRAEG